MSKVGKVVKIALIVTPVAICIYDQVGYVGLVRGRSMQVSSTTSLLRAGNSNYFEHFVY